MPHDAWLVPWKGTATLRASLTGCTQAEEALRRAGDPLPSKVHRPVSLIAQPAAGLRGSKNDSVSVRKRRSSGQDRRSASAWYTVPRSGSLAGGLVRPGGCASSRRRPDVLWWVHGGRPDRAGPGIPLGPGPERGVDLQQAVKAHHGRIGKPMGAARSAHLSPKQKPMAPIRVGSTPSRERTAWKEAAMRRCRRTGSAWSAPMSAELLARSWAGRGTRVVVLMGAGSTRAGRARTRPPTASGRRPPERPPPA